MNRKQMVNALVAVEAEIAAAVGRPAGYRYLTSRWVECSDEELAEALEIERDFQ